MFGVACFCDLVGKEIPVLAEGYGVGLDSKVYFHSVSTLKPCFVTSFSVVKNTVCPSVAVSVIRLPSLDRFVILSK